jgi:hypothetical protein
MALSLKENYCFLLRIKYHALIRLGVSPLSSAQMNSTFSVIVSTSKFDIETPELKIPFSFHFLSLGRSWSAMAFHHRKKRSGRNAVMRIFFCLTFLETKFLVAGTRSRHCQSRSGLPDLSWHNIPKWGKMYQIATKLPDFHKIFQMDVIYISNGHRIYRLFSFQGPPKFTKICIFWFEYIPSGNPGHAVPMKPKEWI